MDQAEHTAASLPERAAGGVVLLAFGIAMLAIGWDYPVGRLTQMGPGYLPMAIGTLVCLLSAAILWLDLSDTGIAAGPAIQWRGLIFVSAAILVFAGLVEATGLVPAMFLAVVVSKLADRNNRPLGILVYAVLATIAGWLLFLVVLELPFPAFWR
ncbi:hypothetical protein HKCCE2091_08760 [Rhodobacterales bacterium HKCCE2091]|nr:hypothetical protein [Rhodobacterales bacterium HKCCE2091]